MSAQAQMKKMLEQLMGPQDDEDTVRHFTDKDVCWPFLVDICINDLFINTREDIGPCDKIHSETMRNDFEKASLEKDFGIEQEVLGFIKDFINKNDKKVAANKKRLEAEETPELESKAKEIHDLGVQIGEKLAKAESLGSEGDVDGSLAMTAEVEQLKKKKKEAEDLYRASVPVGSNQHQQLRACDVCGALLSLYDNDRRLADHFGGKLHLGFVAIREKVVQLEKRIEDKKRIRQERRFRKDSGRGNYKEERQQQHRRRSRSRSRDRRRRSRSRSREPRRRSRSREREKDHKRRSRERR